MNKMKDKTSSQQIPITQEDGTQDGQKFSFSIGASTVQDPACARGARCTNVYTFGILPRSGHTRPRGTKPRNSAWVAGRRMMRQVTMVRI